MTQAHYLPPLPILSSTFAQQLQVTYYPPDSHCYTVLTSKNQDSEVISDWRSFDEKISMHISDLDGTAKHLNEINNLSNASRVRIQKNLALRHQAAIEPEEPAKFPIRMLPYKQNPKFYGREAELEKINNALDWKIKGNDPLRTYTIYGRRGVGKTQLALQYAYKNPANFEAIFWVRCETGLYLRQSFTDMANVINLPGANKHGEQQLYPLNSAI